MSEQQHTGLRGVIEALGRNEMLAAFNRLVGLASLPVIGWLGLQVWGDIKEGQATAAQGVVELRGRIEGAAIELRTKIDGVAGDVNLVRINQAITDTKLQGIERRIDRIETPAPTKGKSK